MPTHTGPQTVAGRYQAVSRQWENTAIRDAELLEQRQWAGPLEIRPLDSGADAHLVRCVCGSLHRIPLELEGLPLRPRCGNPIRVVTKIAEPTVRER